MLVLKWIIKTILILFAGLILTIFLFYSFGKFRQSRKYKDRITITAYWMKYACGECSLDMKVKEVNNKKYNFIVDHEIFPTPDSKSSGELCDFIGSIKSTNPDYVQEAYVLEGYLHKYPHGFSIFDCEEAPFFTVERIKYGKKGKWINY